MNFTYDSKLYDTDTMSRDEIMLIKVKVESDIDAIQSQLKRAHDNLKENGIHADRVWYRKAESALKFKGRLIQSLQVILSQRKTEKRRSVCEYFIDVARENLLSDVFHEILEEANKRAAEDN